MIKVKCPHCPKEMNIGDEYAGKKIRCPACKEVVAVDGAPTAVQPAPAPRPPAPIQKEIQPAELKRRRFDEQDDELAEVMPAQDADEDERRPRKRFRRDDDDDEREYHDRPRRRGRQGQYADCPGCDAPGDAKRVGFTWWGGALGPWLLTHVRCNHCGICYNGRTGQSNTLGITIYTVVGLFIGVTLGGIAIVLSALK
jgi:hypothetical protein